MTGACTLNLNDLKARPKSIVEAVHQCCGNPHEPSVPTRRIANVRRGWAWQRFRLPWQPVDQGEVQLCVRAIEAAGAGQPPAGARNAIHTVQIVVR